MSTEKQIMDYPVSSGSSAHITVDLGATGKAIGDVSLKKESKNGGSLGNIDASDIVLTELGYNLYDVELTDVALDTPGHALVLLSGSTINRQEIQLRIAEIAPQDVNVVSMDNGVITASKIAAGAITATTLASDTISNVKIADNAISASKLASNAITADKIATDAITTGKIADGAITGVKLAASCTTAIALAVWHFTLTSITDVTSIGYRLKTFVDTQLSTMATTLGLVKTQTDKMTFTGANINSDPKTAIAMSTADKQDIADRIFSYTYKTKKAVSGSFAQAINWMGSYLYGERGLNSNGTLEEVYEEDGATLASSHTIVRDTEGKAINRSARF